MYLKGYGLIKEKKTISQVENENKNSQAIFNILETKVTGLNMSACLF